MIGQARTLTPLQGNVARVRPTLEAVDHVSQSRATFGEVGRVDLRDVAEANHLGARAGTRHEGLHLLRRQVLGLVDDEELVDEGATTHEVQGLHLDPAADQVHGGSASPFRAVGR